MNPASSASTGSLGTITQLFYCPTSGPAWELIFHLRNERPPAYGERECAPFDIQSEAGPGWLGGGEAIGTNKHNWNTCTLEAVIFSRRRRRRFGRQFESRAPIEKVNPNSSDVSRRRRGAARFGKSSVNFNCSRSTLGGRAGRPDRCNGGVMGIGASGRAGNRISAWRAARERHLAAAAWARPRAHLNDWRARGAPFGTRTRRVAVGLLFKNGAASESRRRRSGGRFRHVRGAHRRATTRWPSRPNELPRRRRPKVAQADGARGGRPSGRADKSHTQLGVGRGSWRSGARARLRRPPALCAVMQAASCITAPARFRWAARLARRSRPANRPLDWPARPAGRLLESGRRWDSHRRPTLKRPPAAAHLRRTRDGRATCVSLDGLARPTLQIASRTTTCRRKSI